MDPGLRDQLISLAATYRQVASANLPETTLPVTTYSNYVYNGYNLGDVDFAVQPQDNQVIRAWDAGALPAPAAPTSVQVFNAAGSPHLAAQTGTALTAAGLHVTTEADTTVAADPAETLIRYSPGQLAQGTAVLAHFAGAVTLQSDPQVPPGTVRVDVGTSETVTPPATTSAPTAPTAPTGPTAPTSRAQPTPTVPTIGGAPPSSSATQLTPYDPGRARRSVSVGRAHAVRPPAERPSWWTDQVSAAGCHTAPSRPVSNGIWSPADARMGPLFEHLDDSCAVGAPLKGGVGQLPELIDGAPQHHGHTIAGRFAQAEANVLGHQIEPEPVVERAGHHLLGELVSGSGVGSRADVDDVEHQSGVEPRLSGEGQSLSCDGDGGGGQQVVDELDELGLPRPAADHEHLGPYDVEQRADKANGVLGARDHHGERPTLSTSRATADGRVHTSDATAGQFGRHLFGRRRTCG